MPYEPTAQQLADAVQARPSSSLKAPSPTVPPGLGVVTWDYVVPSQCSASFSRLTGLLKVP